MSLNSAKLVNILPVSYPSSFWADIWVGFRGGNPWQLRAPNRCKFYNGCNFGGIDLGFIVSDLIRYPWNDKRTARDVCSFPAAGEILRVVVIYMAGFVSGSANNQILDLGSWALMMIFFLYTEVFVICLLSICVGDSLNKSFSFI